MLSVSSSTPALLPIKKGSWSQREHISFVEGVIEYGWNQWSTIAKTHIRTRTRTQVASRAFRLYVGDLQRP